MTATAFQFGATLREKSHSVSNGIKKLSRKERQKTWLLTISWDDSRRPKSAVQIFDTHKKAHVKWAPSGFIFMF